MTPKEVHLPQQLRCHVCGGNLEKLTVPTIIRWQVTSDCRPWPEAPRLAACADCGIVQKPISLQWQRDAEKIYASYAVYAQGGGAEESSFDCNGGESMARSRRIVQWLREKAKIPERGQLLDIGCGNGSFLRAFNDDYPKWDLIGAELDDRNRRQIEAIPGVKKLHVGSLDGLVDQFDLIVMVHVLEHVPRPEPFLRLLQAKLKHLGKILIEVPDLERSPFDLLIADHRTHFSTETLKTLLLRTGYTIYSSDVACIPKEITTLAEVKTDRFDSFVPPFCNDRHVALDNLSWLELLLDAFRSEKSQVGIFGSSISATWLASTLGELVQFFVDEDQNRVGGHHLGLPILNLKSAPPDVRILVPMRYDIASKIAQRLSTINPNIVIPPTVIQLPLKQR